MRKPLNLRPLLRRAAVPAGLRGPMVAYYADIYNASAPRVAAACAANAVLACGRHAARHGWQNTSF